MTVIRPARTHEIPALTTVAGDDERNAATAAYLEKLLDVGCTRPEWCLVAEAADGTLRGNVVLWSPPGRDLPMDIVLFEPHDAALGAELLAAAGDLARSLGAEDQGHVLDQPAQAPQFQRDPQLRADLLSAAGFTLDRDGCRFKWGPDSAVPSQDQRLTWKSLADLGEEPFVDLLQDALSQTADAIFQAEVADHGLRAAAELNFQECLEYEHKPEWYEIGFTTDGSPAALVLAARNATFPVIALIGVASGHRGQGFATAAVARGTQTLAGEGATEVRGDCDAANIGMFKAFQRCGFDNFADRQMYARAL